MAHDVKVVTVRDCPTAVVACTTTWDKFPTLWKGLLNQVWAFLANTDLRTDGHNIMLYRDVGTALQVEVGVQVVRAFESAGAVVPSKLPAGRAAMTTHGVPTTPSDRLTVRCWTTARRRACDSPPHAGKSTATGMRILLKWKPKSTGCLPESFKVLIVR